MAKSRTRGQLQLVKIAENAGWRVRPTKHGYFIYPPDGSDYVAISGSPGCVNGYRRAVRELRRAGLDV